MSAAGEPRLCSRRMQTTFFVCSEYSQSQDIPSTEMWVWQSNSVWVSLPLPTRGLTARRLSSLKLLCWRTYIVLDLCLCITYTLKPLFCSLRRSFVSYGLWKVISCIAMTANLKLLVCCSSTHRVYPKHG